MTTSTHWFPTAEDSRVLARRITFFTLCRRHYVHLVGDVDLVLRDEREAMAVVEDAFAAILAGQIAVPATDTYRRLREIVLRFAAARVDVRRAVHAAPLEPEPEMEARS